MRFMHPLPLDRGTQHGYATQEDRWAKAATQDHGRFPQLTLRHDKGLCGYRGRGWEILCDFGR